MKVQTHTFGFGDKLTTVNHLHLANWSIVRVGLLILNRPDDVLTRDHLAKHHVEAEWKRHSKAV